MTALNLVCSIVQSVCAICMYAFVNITFPPPFPFVLFLPWIIFHHMELEPSWKDMLLCSLTAFALRQRFRPVTLQCSATYFLMATLLKVYEYGYLPCFSRRMLRQTVFSEFLSIVISQCQSWNFQLKKKAL